MRLIKVFVLSSSHCRDNFNTLSQYWGLKMGDDNKKIKFHERDKEKFVPALFQINFSSIITPKSMPSLRVNLSISFWHFFCICIVFSRVSFIL